jgi:hypothetical protein
MKRIGNRLRRILRIERQNEWVHNEYFDEKWRARIYKLSSFINSEDGSVCDFGCGKGWLKEYIPTSLRYFGVDYVRRDEETIVCDVNRRALPPSECMSGVVFCSGFFEYMNEPLWLAEVFAQNARKIVISYCTLESFPEMRVRKELAWKNHFTTFSFINLFMSHGYILAKIDREELNTLFSFERTRGLP